VNSGCLSDRWYFFFQQKKLLPVYNKFFNAKIAPPEDPEYSYNQIQVFVAIVIGLLTALGQYMKYKETPKGYFLKKIWLPTLIAIIAASLILAFGKINYEKKSYGFMAAIWVAVASSVYTIIANAAYIWLGIKGKLKLSGGSIAHVGFGMVLLGILISSAKKEVLSNNIDGVFVPLGSNEDPRENLTLIQGVSSDMGKYQLTYEKDSLSARDERTFFKIRFKSKDGKEEFVLEPNSFINANGKEGLMSNPDARHYWTHDVFTYITSLPNPESKEDTATFKSNSLKPGDSLFYSNGYMILQAVKKVDSLPEEIFGKNGSLYACPIKIHSKTGSIYSVTSRLAMAKGGLLSLPDTIISENLVLELQKVNPDNTIELGVKESTTVTKFVTLKAYKFPFIRLLWFGVIITAIGILISMVRRIRLNRTGNTQS
jgi:cytochrome c-type biogenesis protein CcmF